jgi:HPt (histidine-containing phosphotransfer) domain-containing protein
VEIGCYRLIAPSTNMNNQIEIDWEQLHQISEDSPEFERELLEMLAEDVTIHLDELRGAIERRDLETMLHESHYIKGASANVGIVDMALAARQVEDLARASTLDGAMPLVERMFAVLTQLENYLATAGN